MTHSFNTPWSVWFHSITDTSWTKSSYKHIYDIQNLYDLKGIQDTLQKHHLQNGMFFIMRDDIFPTWEDPDNREGCCVSFKVPGDTLRSEWNALMIRVLGESIHKDPDRHMEVTGLSIAPKKEFNIIKVWLRHVPETGDYTEWLQEYEPYFVKDKAIVKAHDLSY
jgi:hypothetical protein